MKSKRREERLREYIMPFGKWRGSTLEDIYYEDKSYLEWCVDNLEIEKIRLKIEEVLDDMSTC